MPTILLVEDNENNRDFLSRRLERQGYVVIAAQDGEQGYSLADSEKPDLILMDISMPVLNGLQATRKIRQLQIPTKIAILSMHDSGEMAILAKEAGADACLVKTCGTEELLKAVEALLNAKQ